MHIYDYQNRLKKLLSDSFFAHDDYLLEAKWLNFSPPFTSLKKQDEVALIDADTFENSHPLDVLAFLKTYEAFLIFTTTPQKADKVSQSWSDLIQLSEKCLGLFVYPETDIQKSLLRNQFLYFKNHLSQQHQFKNLLLKLSTELSELIQSSVKDNLKAKKIFELAVPKRKDEHKGLSIFCRYNVGMSGHNEFYDVIKTPHKLQVILFHSSSYLASSTLIGLFNKYKATEGQIQAEDYFQAALSEIQNLSKVKTKPVKLEIFFWDIDLFSLEFMAHHYGSHQMLSNLQGKMTSSLSPKELFALNPLAVQRGQLAADERILLLSPGLVKNWNHFQLTPPLERFWTDFKDASSSDILTEIFYKVKKVTAEQSLFDDSTVVILEVHRHGIKSV